MRRQPVLKSVAEIAINVTDLPKMQAFYEQVLGFEPFDQHPAENPTIVFLKIIDLDTALGRWGHQQLFVLIDVDRHPPAVNRFRGMDVHQSTLNHLAFEIASDEFETQQRWLESHGLSVQIQEFPAHRTRALFVQDPEGNVLEFICPHLP